MVWYQLAFIWIALSEVSIQLRSRCAGLEKSTKYCSSDTLRLSKWWIRTMKSLNFIVRLGDGFMAWNAEELLLCFSCYIQHGVMVSSTQQQQQQQEQHNVLSLGYTGKCTFVKYLWAIRSWLLFNACDYWSWAQKRDRRLWTVSVWDYSWSKICWVPENGDLQFSTPHVCSC